MKLHTDYQLMMLAQLKKVGNADLRDVLKALVGK